MLSMAAESDTERNRGRDGQVVFFGGPDGDQFDVERPGRAIRLFADAADGLARAHGDAGTSGGEVHGRGGQIVEQAAGLGKAAQGGGRAGHVRLAGRQVGFRHAQGPVAAEEAMAAGGAMEEGALEGQRPRTLAKVLARCPA